MALPLRGIVQTSTAVNGANQTLTFDATAAPRQGDITFLFGGHAGTSATLAGPSTAGYTLLTSRTTSGGPKCGIWYKVQGATPDTTVVGVGGGNASDGVAYVAFCLDGTLVDSAIFDTTPTFQSTGSVTAVPNAPSITVVTPGSWVVAVGFCGVSDSARGTVTNYTLIQGANANDTADISTEAVYREMASAGAEDPPAWSAWLSGVGMSVSFVIKPAADQQISGTMNKTSTLSSSMSADGNQIFNGTFAKTSTLSSSMSAAGNLIFTATMDATSTLSSSMAASGTNTPDAGDPLFTGTMAATSTLSSSMSAAGNLIFNGAMSATSTLSSSMNMSGIEIFTGTLAKTSTLISSMAAAGILKFNGAMNAVSTIASSMAATGTNDSIVAEVKKHRGRRPQIKFIDEPEPGDVRRETAGQPEPLPFTPVGVYTPAEIVPDPGVYTPTPLDLKIPKVSTFSNQKVAKIRKRTDDDDLEDILQILMLL